MKKSIVSYAVPALLLAMMSSGASSDEESHRAAAEGLLQATNVEKTMQAAMDQMLAVQMKANPNLKPFEEVMKQFLNKYLSYAALKDELIAIYAAEFTEAEMNEIAAFYRTPTGKKAIEKMPSLMQKSAELGMKRVQDNSAELRQTIEAEVKKAQDASQPKP